MHAVPVTVILPVDPFPYDGMPEREDKPFKTLYLLHGGFGSQNDWIYYTNIKNYAEAHNLAVVIPAGNNQFFADQRSVHENYGEYVGQELVEITRKMFPLSRRREDTFIAGCSMGGYAALKLGIKYNETFGYAAGISVPTVIEGLRRKDERRLPVTLGGVSFIEAVFGDVESFEGSENDLVWLAEQKLKGGGELPKLRMICGSSDGLLDENLKISEEFRSVGCDILFSEEEGTHDWKFWDAQIRSIIDDWLPVEPNIFESLRRFLDESE